VERGEAMERLTSSAIARLATVTNEGRPHIVPIVFAIENGTLYFAVDKKPKKTTDLQRLKNIAANPAVSVLADHYEDDWSKLWWVRADGIARVVTDSAEAERAVELLANKYEQHRRERPAGPVVAISLDRVTGWSGKLDTVRRPV
jgi:PPOX class probable F420-dependent enzyme